MTIITDHIWSIGGAILALAIVLYLVIIFYLYVFQSRLIYHPVRAMTMNPAYIGLEYEDVNFQAKDGIRLHGWFVTSPDSRGVVLLCHGNAGNISGRLELIRILNSLSLDVFIFDYRGYGNSAGNPTEAGTYKDAEAAWDYVTSERSIEARRIIVFGRSLGGAIAAYLTQKRHPAALIIEGSFTSAIDIGAKLYRFLPVRMLSRFEYPTRDFLTRINCPAMILHSKEDELIPFSHGRSLYASIGGEKMFMELQGSHNEAFLKTPKDYSAAIDSFVAKYVTDK